MVEFGKILRSLRIKAGLTQKQLAEKMGVTSSVVSYYELSERNPSPEILVKLSHIFHVTTDYLLGIEREKNDSLDIKGLSKEEVGLLEHMIAVLRDRKNQRF